MSEEKKSGSCCEGLSYEVTETESGIRISITSEDPEKVESLKRVIVCCKGAKGDCC